jgi:hypothetical protein
MVFMEPYCPVAGVDIYLFPVKKSIAGTFSGRMYDPSPSDIAWIYGNGSQMLSFPL